MKHLAAVMLALQAGDRAAARDHAIQAWTKWRVPELAELVEVLDAGLPPDALRAQLAGAITARVATTEPNITALTATDPRLSKWALDQLLALPFVTPGAEDLLLALVAIVRRHDDPRLAAMAKAIRSGITTRIGRLAVRTAVDEAVEEAVDMLKPPRENAENRALVDAIGKLVEPLRKSSRDATTLLAEVYANPHDDAPRLVYADLLSEQGDPRGEFITLQLERAAANIAEPSDREKTLLKKHGKAWLGALAPVISWGKGYSGSEFRRGFLAKADIIGSVGKKLAPITHDPAWSTVEQLEGSWSWEFALEARLPALAEIDRSLGQELITRLATRKSPLVGVTSIRLDETAGVPAELLRRVFPNLRTIKAYATMFRAQPVDQLGAYGVAEIVITHNWFDANTIAAGRAQFAEMVARLLRDRAFCDRLELDKPYVGRESLTPLVLVRGSDGRFVQP